MTSSALALALRIAQLIEQHSEKDIRAAIALLETHGIGSPLLDFLALVRTNADSPKRKLDYGSPPASVGITNSRAVLQLREADPEKFRLLNELDQMIRYGKILSRFSDLKRFGEEISKAFQPKKSRKETIERIISMLAEHPLPEIEKLIQHATSFGTAGDGDEYQRLSKFILNSRLKSE